MTNNIQLGQWYVIIAASGKEDAVAKTIENKIHAYGLESYIGAIRIFKRQDVKVETFDKNSNMIPASPKKTKTIEWKILSNGKYQRTKTRVVNKYSTYIFINVLDDKEVLRDLFGLIRNTPGVHGILGMSGRGALPIPISIEEYTRLSDGEHSSDATEPTAEATSEVATQEQTTPVTETKLYVTDAKVGQTIEIFEGALAGTTGDIKKLDDVKGIALVEIEMFGRVQEIEVPYNQFKLSIE